MKDAVADDGDAFMRVCRMYTTINHWGIAYTTINHRGTILCIQQSTIGVRYCVYNNQRSITKQSIEVVMRSMGWQLTVMLCECVSMWYM